MPHQGIADGEDQVWFMLRDVAFWHDCDIILCRLEFRLRPLSGREAETPGGPRMTHKRHRTCDYSITPSARLATNLADLREELTRAKGLAEVSIATSGASFFVIPAQGI